MRLIEVTALIIGLVLAPPILAGAQESENVKSPSTEGIPALSPDLRVSLMGSWEGTCRTWFEPDKLADESKIKATIRPVPGGRFFRQEDEAQFRFSPGTGRKS